MKNTQTKNEDDCGTNHVESIFDSKI
jgi:hypothetical protein